MRFRRTTVVLASLSALAITNPAASGEADRASTAEILDGLGGKPCPDDSVFTCVTIAMPLDHLNPDDGRTIDVVFAVLPASGERKGMYVTAVGGPGGSGVSAADDYLEMLDPGVPERFDQVFFDPRGVALSGGVDCPTAASSWYGEDWRAETPGQEAAAKNAASTFARGCVDELDPKRVAWLPYLGTGQAVEDLEIFRQIMGDDRFWFYGESYGTQYAQTYAAAHGDHLAGLILDGTVDLTLNVHDFFTDLAVTFGHVLEAGLNGCDEDPACAKDVGRSTLSAYDDLARRLEQDELSVAFPVGGRTGADRRFSILDLQAIGADHVYGPRGRMRFNRALAAWASRQDLVPLARLKYAVSGVDGITLQALPGDSSSSDAMYYAVDCRDFGFPGAGPSERADRHLRAGDRVEKTSPRLASTFTVDLPCAYWPAATSELRRPEPLEAEGVPTLVLGAPTDPATPYQQGVRVFRRLDDGHLITHEGGPHIIFGRGVECVDGPVTRFLLTGRTPARRETVCAGAVTDEYVPLAPRDAAGFENPAEALTSADTEIGLLPEYYNWDGSAPVTVGCSAGGLLRIVAGDRGDGFAFDRCAFTKGFTFTGTGLYDPEADRFELDVATTGRWECTLRQVRTQDGTTTTGSCDGGEVGQSRSGGSGDVSARAVKPEPSGARPDHDSPRHGRSGL